jgi:hypothetical protein
LKLVEGEVGNDDRVAPGVLKEGGWEEAEEGGREGGKKRRKERGI